MGHSTTTGPPWTFQEKKSSYTRPRNSSAHGSSMTRKVITSAHPHSTNDAAVFTYRRHGERTSPKKYIFFFHNGAIPAMSSADAATDVYRRLADGLANPALAAPTSSCAHQTTNALIKQRSQLTPVSATSYQESVGYTPIFPCISGAAYSHRPHKS